MPLLEKEAASDRVAHVSYPMGFWSPLMEPTEYLQQQEGRFTISKYSRDLLRI